MDREEMVIFARTFDLLDWLLPATNHFPRAHRHTVTRRLLDAAFDLRERLEEANLRRGRARQERLRLVLHSGAQPRPVTEGLPFLGFVVYPDCRRLKRRKGMQFRRRFRALVRRHLAGELPLERVTAAAQGWANHARYGNTVGLRKAILGSVVLPGRRIEG